MCRLIWLAVWSSSTSTWRGCSQQPQQLGLRLDLGGHQVEDGDLQGPDVLGLGPLVGHNEDILRFQDLDGGQVRLDADGIVSQPFKKGEKAAELLKKALAFPCKDVVK